MLNEEYNEDVHWAFVAAKKVISEKGDKDTYTCATGITPSGVVHIGNFREIITVDLVVKALQKLGKKTRFIYSWDDYDVFRKIPKDMPNQEMLKKYLRFPIVDVPDPYERDSSYAEHHEKDVENSLPLVNIHPEFIRQSIMYRKCKYAQEIEYALKNTGKIKKILDKFRTEQLEESWLPVSIFCEKCNMDTITEIKHTKAYTLYYKCECGHEDEFDFRKKGIAKLLWRVDWPMRWYYEKVDFEPGGKDHSTEGGSYSTGRGIVKELWNRDAPTYVMYDFVSIKGKGGKISSSLGGVITLKDVLEVYEPEMTRWIFAGARPNSEFAISFDVDVIKLYEDFDRCERIFYEAEEVSEKEKKKQSLIYELSQLDKPAKKMPIQPSFRHVTNMLMILNFDTEKTENYFNPKTAADKKRINNRVFCAKNWIEKYAPDDFKFAVNKEKNVKYYNSLNSQQKKAVEGLKNAIKEFKGEDEDKLATSIFEIPGTAGIETKDFFKTVYMLIIGKEKGPKLAPFILEVGKERVVELL